MENESIITISASLCAVLITLLLMTGTLLGGRLGEKINRWFFLLLLCNLFGSLCEVVSAALTGVPGVGIGLVIQAVEFTNYALGSFVFITFAFYFYEYVSAQTKVSKRPFYLVTGFNLANLILLAALLGTGQLIHLDAANHSTPTSTVWLAQIFPLLSTITIVISLLRYRREVSLRAWISLFSFLLIQIFCYLIENAFPGVWVSYLGSAVSTFIIYINIQAELSRRLTEQEMALSEQRVAVMLSQIQPHFLYNALGAIDQLVETDPEKAHEAILTFSEYLRGNMDSLTQKAWIPFTKELEHVRAYLWLEQLRFGERLQVVCDFTATDFLLPVLTVQPLVENAVRHGVTKQAAGGRITIRTLEGTDSFFIVVRDDGVGFDVNTKPQDGRSHYGLANVRSRLGEGGRGRLTIESEPGVGTVASIEIFKTGGQRDENHRR